MTSQIDSTITPIKNATAAQLVVDGYIFDFEVQIEHAPGSDAGTIHIVGSEDALAIQCALLPDPGSVSDEEYDDFVFETLVNQGADGFVALLQDLTPHLAEPMTVVSVWNADGSSLVRTWTLQPRRLDPFSVTLEVPFY